MLDKRWKLDTKVVLTIEGVYASDMDYCDLNEQYHIDVDKVRYFINMADSHSMMYSESDYKLNGVLAGTSFYITKQKEI